MNTIIVSSHEPPHHKEQSNDIADRTTEDLLKDLKSPNCTIGPLLENRIFHLNTQLAVSIASKLARNATQRNELISEAKRSLMEAIRTYRIGEVPFGAYAYKNIRWHLLRICYEDNEFGFRGSAARMLHRARRLAWKCNQKEVVFELNDDDPLRRMVPFIVPAIREDFTQTCSDRDSSAFNIEQIASEDTRPDRHAMLQYDSQGALAIARQVLSKRDYEVFCSLIGIDGRPLTKSIELAKHYALSQQRIQQIWTNAINRIRKRFIQQ